MRDEAAAAERGAEAAATAADASVCITLEWLRGTAALSALGAARAMIRCMWWAVVLWLLWRRSDSAEGRCAESVARGRSQGGQYEWEGINMSECSLPSACLPAPRC